MRKILVFYRFRLVLFCCMVCCFCADSHPLTASTLVYGTWSSVLCKDTLFYGNFEEASVGDSTRVMPVASPSRRTACWAVKTNLLYDAVLIPNVGIEYDWGKSWSVAADWMYIWLKSDSRHRYWRIYGGDVELNRWFGRKALGRHFSGHHLGVYAQCLTYDIEWGSRGYLGDKWTYGGGFVYGYALPLNRCLNLDFSLGIGYLGGTYKEYLPMDGHYVWQKTRKLNWWGPTRLAVSLVWRLGRNDKKED